MQKIAKTIRYPDERLSAQFGGKLIGKYQDFDIKVAAGDFLGEAVYTIGNKYMYKVNKYESPVNMTKYLISKLDELPNSLEMEKEALRVEEGNLENARNLVNKPFEYEDELKEKQARLSEIVDSMDQDADYSSDDSLDGQILYDEDGNLIEDIEDDMSDNLSDEKGREL